MTQSSKCAVAFIFTAIGAQTAALDSASADEIVFESLSGQLGGGSGFNNLTEVGEAIGLAGSARTINNIDLYLGSNAEQLFHVRFYHLNGTNSSPGTLLWESSVQTFPANPVAPGTFYERFINIPVPNVVVPESFAWIVAPLTPSGNSIQVVFSNGPTIGTYFIMWRRNSSGWQTFAAVPGGFGARLTAVPEPSALGLLGTGALSLGLVRLLRRKKSPPSGHLSRFT